MTMRATATHALVLTSPDQENVIDQGIVDDIERLALDRGAVTATRWLAPQTAWEAQFVSPPEQDLPKLRRRIGELANGRPIDINFVSADPASRRKKLLVADMESTIIQQECLDEMAGFVGLLPRIADITARAMRGELEFAAALKERVSLLRGADSSLLERTYELVTLMPGAETLIGTMRKNGATCALVSGGFTFFTERIATRLGFDIQQANTIELADGRIAGTVAEPILGREAKLEALERLALEHKLDAVLTMAVGDGANDLAMLKAAGLGVAFRAKPIVAEEAAASIVHGDLTALLYLQGYTRAEFV
jgi:phosphoserine phosphatase